MADPRGPASAGRPLEGRSGQALVEFSLVISVLVMLLVGVADFGRVFYYDVMVSAAALEGARAAANGATDDGIRSAIQNSTTGPSSAGITSLICDAKPACWDVAPSASQRTAGTTTNPIPVWTTVTAKYQFTPITPLTQWLMSEANHTIVRSASMRMRQGCALADGTPC